MSPDHNLLFAILALQADFIDQRRFVEACTLWASRKATPLADVLVERGWLSSADRADVEKLVERKLKKNNGDCRASIAEAANGDVRQSLAAVADDEVQRSLAGLPHAGHSLVATMAYTPEGAGRYTLTHLHAKGGIGQVWIAQDHEMGRMVALKEPRPEHAGNDAQLRRFLAEARIAGQLDHPNIVPVHEIAYRPDDGRPYYTMRFVRGRTLSQAISSYHQRRKEARVGPLELRELLDSFVDVCNAVAFAHSKGVIHRDLKGQNVVLGDFGEVVLLDWGLAKLVGQPEVAGVTTSASGRAGLAAGGQTVQGQVLGTPAYMVPEQAAGQLGLINEKTDVYGLGAMLYEVLTGQVPFSGDDTADVLQKVQREEPPRPRQLNGEVPRALQAICLKAMAKEQTQRYASASELARDVQHWLGNEPVSAYPAPLSERLARWGRRHQALAASVVSILAAVVLLLTVGLVLLQLANWEIAEQRTRAELNFEESLSVLQNSLGSVDLRMERSPLPGLQPLRRDILKTQLRNLEAYPVHYRKEKRLRSAMASAYFKLGKLSEDLGPQGEALDALQKSRALYLDLKRDYDGPPTPNLYVDQLAHCSFGMGKVHRICGRPTEAIEAFKDCLRLEDELLGPAREADAKWAKSQGASRESRAWTYLELIAWSATYLARAEHAAGRTEDARQSFERGLSAFQELAQEKNKSISTYPYFENGWGWCLLYQGQFLQELGASDEARKCFEEAVAHLRRAIVLNQERPQPSENNPHQSPMLGSQAPRPDNRSNLQFQSVLAFGLNTQGMWLLENDQPAPAGACFDEALQILQPLHRDNPDVIWATQERLALTHVNLGDLHLVRQEPEAAEKAYLASLELTRDLERVDPENVNGIAISLCAKRGLGMAQLSRGRNEEAVKVLKEAVALGSKVGLRGPADQYNLAGAQAQLSAALRQGVAEEALATLRRAHANGYRNIAWMRRDPALRPLRDVPEFQELVKQR